MVSKKLFAVFAIAFLALPLFAAAVPRSDTTMPFASPTIRATTGENQTGPHGENNQTSSRGENNQNGEQEREKVRAHAKQVVDNVIERAKGLFSKLDRLVVLLKEKGVNTTAIEADIGEFKASVTSAENRSGTSLREAVTDLRDAIHDVNNIQKDLRDDVREYEKRETGERNQAGENATGERNQTGQHGERNQTGANETNPNETGDHNETVTATPAVTVTPTAGSNSS